ncbi:hypothetical protein vBVpaMR16F_22 [Vibrio phage vB_VpaM_R16F]|nr:hypothetical protein vBVpaMR16F_22 [Vibrio phage vB_VpaM_R16F]
MKRPVFIYYGGSCLCKSHTAALTGKSIYETDVSEILPDTIKSEIIVIGNRSGFTLQDVEDRIYNKDNCKIIKVEFNQ